MIRSLINNKTFTLAENPIWDDVSEGYYFIDIKAQQILHYSVKQEKLTTWQLDETIGCMALADDGNAILGLSSGVYHYNFATESKTFIGHPLKDYPDTVRYNEGKVSFDGHFWFASMDESSDRAPIAALFCLTPAGKIHTALDGVRVGNGIAFDEKRDRMYYADTRAPGIFYDTYSKIKSDTISGKGAKFGHFLEVKDDIGRPDGCNLDAEGNYWSAGVSAGRLNCFSPSLELRHSIELPCDNPTMPCFGGKDLDQLIVTSLNNGKTENNNNGGVFEVRINNVSIKGQQHYKFAYKFVS